jgi:hypothetical protein
MAAPFGRRWHCSGGIAGEEFFSFLRTDSKTTASKGMAPAIPFFVSAQ